MSSFARTFIVGVFWSFFSRFFRQAFDFLATLFLARVLSPLDFGLFGTSYLFMGFLYLLYDAGLGAALVQRKEISEKDYSTVFWSGIGIGLFLTLFTYFGAPFVGAFFNNQFVEQLVKVLSFQFLFIAPGIVGRARLARDLNFRRLAVLDGVITAVYGVAALFFAYQGQGVWSIVWGSFAANIVGMFLVFVLCPYVPAFSFSYRRLVSLLRYGSGVAGLKSTEYLSDNIDYLFVGRFLGAYALGVYTFAFNLATFPVRKVAPIVTDVFFPAFSKLQDDTGASHAAYIRVFSFVSFVIMPFFVILFFSASDLITFVYGDHWKDAAPLVRIIVLGSYFGVVWSVTQSLMLSKGKSYLTFAYSVMRFLFLFILLPFGIRYGAAGVSYIVSLYYTLVIPVFQTIALKQAGISFQRWAKETVWAFFCGGVMSVVMWLVFSLFENGVFRLVVGIASGLVVYFLAVFMVRRAIYRDVVFLIKVLRGTR